MLARMFMQIPHVKLPQMRAQRAPAWRHSFDVARIKGFPFPASAPNSQAGRRLGIGRKWQERQGSAYAPWSGYRRYFPLPRLQGRARPNFRARRGTAQLAKRAAPQLSPATGGG